MGRLAASHAIDVLSERGLTPLVKFSGSNGFHLMWDVPELDGLADDQLWAIERAVVRAVACEVERRLANDPAAEPIRRAVGSDKPAISTSSADRENERAILFDEYILKDNANFRVPYSVHPTTGLVAVPVLPDDLPTFDVDQARPDAVTERNATFALPRYRLEDVEKALQMWREDGC
jgi:DNA primase